MELLTAEVKELLALGVVAVQQRQPKDMDALAQRLIALQERAQEMGLEQDVARTIKSCKKVPYSSTRACNSSESWTTGTSCLIPSMSAPRLPII
jgi:hypothetical protein